MKKQWIDQCDMRQIFREHNNRKHFEDEFHWFLRMFIVILVMLVFYVSTGCGGANPVRLQEYDVWRPDPVSYQEWVNILGDLPSVESYIKNVNECLELCREDEARESLVLDPWPNQSPCLCVK